jgi:cytoskeleton protein RodZ
MSEAFGSSAFGTLIREARVAKGISKEALAFELKLPIRHIEAIENDDWEGLPPGRGRPLARQIATRLGLDLESYSGAFSLLPGAFEEQVPDPKRERLERVAMATLTLGCAALLVWLLVPGPSLRGTPTPKWNTNLTQASFAPPPAPSAVPYPVLGELLPEAPRNEEGTLISLRAQDTCEAMIKSDGGLDLSRTLRVSDPWKLRIKGAFTLSLDNAGVVIVEVAGQRIKHGQSVSESWKGRFDANGHWLRPVAPQGPLPELETLPVDPPVKETE